MRNAIIFTILVFFMIDVEAQRVITIPYFENFENYDYPNEPLHTNLDVDYKDSDETDCPVDSEVMMAYGYSWELDQSLGKGKSLKLTTHPEDHVLWVVLIHCVFETEPNCKLVCLHLMMS